MNAAPRYDRPEAALHPVPSALREQLARETAAWDATHA
jgi:hypothetical protein